ncbi:MAG: hypothetical protein ACT4OS_07080 [Acidimicrobiales bacterium]
MVETVAATTKPAAPPTPETIDPYKWGIPSVRDASYVNRLLAFFEVRNADLLRQTVAANGLTPAVEAGLASIYRGPNFDLAKVSFARAISDPDAAPELARLPAGPFVTAEAQHVYTFSTDCIFVEVRRYFRLLDGYRTEWVAMERRQADRSNPTGWVLIYDGLQDDGSGPDNPCI